MSARCLSTRTLLAALGFAVALGVPRPAASTPLFSGSRFYVFATGNQPYSLVLQDLNGDGVPDLATSNQSSVTVCLGNGDGTFQPRTDYPTGSGGSAIAAADLEGDGALDLVTVHGGSPRVFVLHGRGDGTFAAASELEAAAGPSGIAVGQLNADSWPDLVVTSSSTSAVSVFLGNGDGTFAPRIDYPSAQAASAVAIGDLNGDGHADIAVAGWTSLKVSVHLGNGDGTFALPTEFDTNGFGSRRVAIGDLNGDGHADLVVVTTWSWGCSLVFGNGDGTFQPPVHTAYGPSPTSVVLHDLTADGRLDLLVTYEGDAHEGPPNDAVGIFADHGDGTYEARTWLRYVSGPQDAGVADLDRDGRADLMVLNGRQSNSVAVLLGNPDGSFGPQGLATGSSPQSVAVADLNADGHPDLAVANTASFTLSVFLGAGDGTFAARSDFGTGMSPRSVRVGDMNGDARPDLVVACKDANTVSVLLGRGDGSFGVNTDFGTGGSPYSAALCDANGDGNLDVAVTISGANSVAVLLGDGRGRLGPAAAFPAGNNPVALAPGDLNHDGDADLAVVNNNYSNPGTLSVLLGRGDGAFSPPSSFATANYPQDVAIADLNGDGIPDAAVAGASDVSILPGSGDGSFGARSVVVATSYLGSIAVSDLNGDARPDLVLGSWMGVTVLLSSGEGAFATQARFGTGLGAAAVAIGDLDGDRRTDIAVANAASNHVVVLRNEIVPTPVAVEELRAAPSPGGVLLTWGLSREALNEVIGVRVQRAAALAGPYTDRTAAPLAPALRMSFEDRQAPNADSSPAPTAWYRLALELGSGVQFLVGPVRIDLTKCFAARTELHAPYELQHGGPIHIGYSVGPARTRVRLEVVDVRGRRIGVLDEGSRNPGEYALTWDPRGLDGGHLARGVYLVHLSAGDASRARKLPLLRE